MTLERAGATAKSEVGSGLLAQDWIILEKLREKTLQPCRVVLVDLLMAQPVTALGIADLSLLKGFRISYLSLAKSNIVVQLLPQGETLITSLDVVTTMICCLLRFRCLRYSPGDCV